MPVADVVDAGCAGRGGGGGATGGDDRSTALLHSGHEVTGEPSARQISAGNKGRGIGCCWCGLDCVFSHLVSLAMASMAFLAESKGNVSRYEGKEA